MKNKQLERMKLSVNKSCNEHNPQLLKLCSYGLSFVHQALLITAYGGDSGSEPVNYIVPPKTDGWELACFLADFESKVDVDWVTIYDAPVRNETYEYQTFYVMYIEGNNEELGTWHAIPMFSDLSLRLNKEHTKRKICKYSRMDFELTEEEYALIDELNIVSDTFATLCHWRWPRRPLTRTIITGEVFKPKKFLPESITFYQLTPDGKKPFAFLPISFKDKLPKEGEEVILTDYQAHMQILRYMKFPY